MKVPLGVHKNDRLSIIIEMTQLQHPMQIHCRELENIIDSIIKCRVNYSTGIYTDMELTAKMLELQYTVSQLNEYVNDHSRTLCVRDYLLIENTYNSLYGNKLSILFRSYRPIFDMIFRELKSLPDIIELRDKCINNSDPHLSPITNIHMIATKIYRH